MPRGPRVPDRPIETDASGRPVEACSLVEPEVMFPEGPDGEELENNDPAVLAAKVVCAGCGLRDLCLERAVAGRERWGVWGQHTRREREALRRRRSRADERIARERAVEVVAIAAPETRAHTWAEQLDLFEAVSA